MVFESYYKNFLGEWKSAGIGETSPAQYREFLRTSAGVSPQLEISLVTCKGTLVEIHRASVVSSVEMGRDECLFETEAEAEQFAAAIEHMRGACTP